MVSFEEADLMGLVCESEFGMSCDEILRYGCWTSDSCLIGKETYAGAEYVVESFQEVRFND